MAVDSARHGKSARCCFGRLGPESAIGSAFSVRAANRGPRGLSAATLALAVVAGLAAFAAAPGLSYADELRAGDIAVVAETNSNGLRLRSGPGVSYRVVAVVDEGTRVQIMTGPVSDGDHDWYQLSADGGATGWARGRHLDASSTPTSGARAGGKRVFGSARSEPRSRA